MAENLRTTKCNDGTPIPLVSDGLAWMNHTTPGFGTMVICETNI
jgi:hypothetical protein